MPVAEFNMWLAYFQIQNEERERQERLWELQTLIPKTVKKTKK